MTGRLNKNEKIGIRPYEERDFDNIQKLNTAEGWTNLVENPVHTKKAWENSNVAFVMEEGHGIVGYITLSSNLYLVIKKLHLPLFDCVQKLGCSSYIGVCPFNRCLVEEKINTVTRKGAWYSSSFPLC